MLSEELTVGETIENLLLVSLAYDPGELRDLITYLPVA
jgi:hypothetical protein